MRFYVLALLVGTVLFSCGGSDSSLPKEALLESDEFMNYWKSGMAELNTYQVERVMNDDTINSTVVQLFEYEPFSRRKLVRLENPSEAGDDLIHVLKQNKILNSSKFGSSMLSLFTPADRGQFPNSLKATYSHQTPPGQTFIQLLLSNNNYRVSSHSHKKEYDTEDYNLKKVLLEDELVNIIRLNYNNLPAGKFQTLPSFAYMLMTNRPIEPLVAESSVIKQDSVISYSINYTQPNRSLTITFDNSFPFRIQSVFEEYDSENGRITQRAVLMKSTRVLADSLALESMQ